MKDGQPIPHVAMRPLWRCRNCGGPWPCGQARLDLLAEYKGDRTALLIFLAALKEEAREQLRQLPDVVDYEKRFTEWARAGKP